MAEKKQDQDVDAMLDRMLKRRSPEEVVGSGGLLEELTKRLLERALEGELTDHLGSEKHAEEGRNRGNSRNGRTRKRVKTDTAEMVTDAERRKRWGPSGASSGGEAGTGGSGLGHAILTSLARAHTSVPTVFLDTTLLVLPPSSTST
jgi:hypothetical protein